MSREFQSSNEVQWYQENTKIIVSSDAVGDFFEKHLKMQWKPCQKWKLYAFSTSEISEYSSLGCSKIVPEL